MSSDGPMIVTTAFDIVDDKAVPADVPSHVRTGSAGISLDMHLEDGRCLAVVIYWEDLERLMAATEAYFPPELPAPKDSRKDLIN